MIIAPMIHEITAAGPATRAAAPEPNSQPDPINELKASITPEKRLIFRWRMLVPPFILTPPLHTGYIISSIAHAQRVYQLEFKFCHFLWMENIGK